MCYDYVWRHNCRATGLGFNDICWYSCECRPHLEQMSCFRHRVPIPSKNRCPCCLECDTYAIAAIETRDARRAVGIPDEHVAGHGSTDFRVTRATGYNVDEWARAAARIERAHRISGEINEREKGLLDDETLVDVKDNSISDFDSSQVIQRTLLDTKGGLVHSKNDGDGNDEVNRLSGVDDGVADAWKSLENIDEDFDDVHSSVVGVTDNASQDNGISDNDENSQYDGASSDDKNSEDDEDFEHNTDFEDDQTPTNDKFPDFGKEDFSSPEKVSHKALVLLGMADRSTPTIAEEQVEKTSPVKALGLLGIRDLSNIIIAEGEAELASLKALGLLAIGDLADVIETNEYSHLSATADRSFCKAHKTLGMQART